MRIKITGFAVAAMAVFCAVSCAQKKTDTPIDTSTALEGYVVSGQPLAAAPINLWDATGKQRQTISDEHGYYQLEVTGLTPPLLLSATEAGYDNISDNSKPRGLAVAALVPSIKAQTTSIANLNPLTDKVVSEVAKSLSLRGPVGLIQQRSSAGVTSAQIGAATAATRLLVAQALVDAGLANGADFDPLTTPMNAASFKLYQLIRHNRSYHTKSGEVAATMLFDLLFHPLSPADPLDFNANIKAQQQLTDDSVLRIFIAGDSTVSNYVSEREPRAGWGQMFHAMFQDDAPVLIVNAAISGRSSRSYINEGWLRMYADLVRPGDYLFIEFGHNDEKCGSQPSKPRDVFDRANSCTYANDASGQVQGSAQMSFQHWLERYIEVAAAREATPVILTPLTRITRSADKKSGVFPITQSSHIVEREKSSAQYVGDYAQTARDTARANGVTLIDLDKKTIKLANSLGEPDWKHYWLAVDPAHYPYYQEGKTGNINKPDGTHLQQKGALKVSSLVAEQLKADPLFAELARRLK